MILNSISSRISVGMPADSERRRVSKNIKNWYQKLVDLEVPHKIQPGEYLRGGGKDGFWLQAAGELRVVNVNWNDDGWNVNANPVSNPNERNAGNRVWRVFSRLGAVSIPFSTAWGYEAASGEATAESRYYRGHERVLSWTAETWGYVWIA